MSSSCVIVPKYSCTVFNSMQCLFLSGFILVLFVPFEKSLKPPWQWVIGDWTHEAKQSSNSMELCEFVLLGNTLYWKWRVAPYTHLALIK